MARKYTVEDFAYGGKYNDWFWNPVYNPLATIGNALPNCTTLALGFTFIHKLPYPVTSAVSASNWDKVVTNGWIAVPYGSCNLKVGDIVQWIGCCHVATVIRIENGEPILGCSWYTGQNGKSTIINQEGKKIYDPRTDFNSLKELNDFMIANYPYRFYHEANIADESNMVGGLPEKVLVSPEILLPAGEDKNRNQIHVLTNEQNVRDEELNIIGVAMEGYYNVLSSMKANNHIWYEVQKNKYIAGVSGRVIYIPADDEIENLKRENEELKAQLKIANDKLDKINELSRR